MKKIGKKLSNMVKVLLVLGLIISNLSSLRIVFALEGEENTEPSSEVVTTEGEDAPLVSGEGEQPQGVTATGLETNIEDNKITVKYGTEVNDTDELQIRITESYKYDNCEDTDSIVCETVINNSYTVAGTDRELLLGEGMVINYEPSLLKTAKLDGVYKLKAALVNVTNDNELLDEKIVDERGNYFETGISFSVYDSSDTLVKPTDGKYVFGDETIRIVGKMQAGGISPNDVFSYTNEKDNTTEFTALEILDFEFEKTINIGGYLYAEFELPVSVLYMQNGEEIEYIKQLKISHGTYEDNAKKLNDLVDQSKLLFEGTEKDGKLYVYLGENAVTIDDIDTLLYDTYYDSDNVWYRLSNEELNAETVVTLEDGVTTITYQVVMMGDINGDGILDEKDIVALTDQLVGNQELNIDKANIDKTDDEVNTRDALKLAQIVKSGAWGITVVEKEIELEAALETTDGVTEFVSGDTFEVNYVITSVADDITGFAGLVSYNDSILELESIKVTENYKGSNKDGKFIYIDMTDDKTTSGEVIKLLTLKFNALSNGEDTIMIDSPEFFNGNTYYKIVEIDPETGESTPTTQVIYLDVTVNASSDSSLSSLKLGDNEIQLEDGVYDYTLTVGNDVTSLDVSAIASNIAAEVTSTAPEELVEGENKITITVVSESGEESTYTITVTRESASEETDTETNTTDDNQNASQGGGYSRDHSSNNNTKPSEPSKNDDKKDDEPVVEPVKEKSNLSKIIIIALILLVIAGLIYLIFKDDDDDESKKANKDINKYKKEDFDTPKEKTTDNSNKRNQNQNNKKNQNNRKGR